MKTSLVVAATLLTVSIATVHLNPRSTVKAKPNPTYPTQRLKRLEQS